MLFRSLLLPPLGSGCAERFRAAEERATSPLPRGTLPESLAASPIAVAPIANATGRDLAVPQNLLAEAKRAVGAQAPGARSTVPDLLQQRAVLELRRRGFEAIALEPGAEPAAGACVLRGTLRRFTPTETGLLLVRLDLSIARAEGEEELWSGAATRPVAIPSALTWQEIAQDAGGPIFAEAFGSP